MSGRDARLDLGLALLIALLGVAALAPLVQRDIGWVDSVELALAGSVLGVPHPTGYPLYTLLARLAAALAAWTGSDPAFGVNLLSALGAAVAAALSYRLGRRLGLDAVAAVAVALLVLGSRDLIAQATVAEVYTLHLLLVALLFDLVLAGSGRALLGAAFVFGLGLAHHLTIVLALPPLLLLLARRRPPTPVLLFALALPVTMYLVLLMRSARDPALDLGDPETLPRLLAHVRGRQFGYRLLTSEAAYTWAEMGRFFRLLAAQWSPVAIPWIGIGAVVLAIGSRFHRRVLLAFLVFAGLVVAHAVVYRIPDKEAYYLPVYLVLALFAGALAHGLLAATGRSRGLRIGLSLLVIVLSALPFIVHRSRSDRHADHSLADLAFEVGRRTTPGSLVLSDDTSLGFALRYLTATGRLAPDRTIVAEYFLPLPWYAASLAALDPALPPDVAARAQERRGLRGRALGDRLAQDSRELAGGMVRRAAGQRDVFLYLRDFATEATSFAGLPLADCGPVYQVVSPGGSEACLPDAEFVRLDAYRVGRAMTREERMVARRFAAAANRAGIARVRAGEAMAAESEFQKALALDPDYAQAWLNLGLLYVDYLGRPDQARAAWQRYLDCGPDEPEAARVRSRLELLAPAGTTEDVGGKDAVGAR